ncbi:MAG: peptide chain release factor N(5)-glutamine methyltransferase [Micavibrio sp.]|nr:peptide chain release factor N(5)-glutamine methyltransferase [Micavibrio sp.]
MPQALKDYITQAQDRLASCGIESPELDVSLLVQHVLGWTQTKLFMNSDYILGDDEVASLNIAISRRMGREPVSRIIGHRGFWKSEFKISPQTLDPRPDSETLIEAAVKLVQPAPKRVIDLGTGSGCLLLSLLQEWPEAEGVGLDLSAAAVATAAENAAALKLDERVKFMATDWEAYAAQDGFDVVISNPPYITAEELTGLEPEVIQYDPMLALAGGDDGLDAYRSIVPLLKNLMPRGGWIVFEIGHTQANSVKTMLAEAGGTMIQVFTDLGGSDRIVAAKMP